MCGALLVGNQVAASIVTTWVYRRTLSTHREEWQWHSNPHFIASPCPEIVKEQFIVYIQLAADNCVVLHILSIYIPPTCTQTDTAALDQILIILDCILPDEPIFVLGDLNAHILGVDSFARMCCPCCDLPHQQHPGETFNRGRRLWAALKFRDLLVINGCKCLQGYTCHTTSMQEQSKLAMVD